MSRQASNDKSEEMVDCSRDCDSSSGCCLNAADMPDPPEEPLPSDCCGSGCTPCVFDIYHDEMAKWNELAEMTPEQRAAEMSGRKRNVTSRTHPVALSRDVYKEFELIKREEICDDVYLFEFALPPGVVLGVGVGQHMTLRVKKCDGSYLCRQYTPISKPDQTGSFSVIIRVYRDGIMSGYIRDWCVGSLTSWRGPFGNFEYFPNKYRRILMLACGTGIAPMIQIARAIVENEEEETIVRCLYACKTQHQILAKQELNQFVEYWNFTIVYVLSQSSPESVATDPGKLSYGDKAEFGRITMEMAEKETERMEEGVGVTGREVGDIVLICGTKSFDKDMINFITKGSSRLIAYFKF